MKLRPLLEEFNQDQFYQSIKVHALYSIIISKQDQQASRVEPLHPKLSRILSRVKFRLSELLLLLVLVLVLLLDCDITR